MTFKKNINQSLGLLLLRIAMPCLLALGHGVQKWTILKNNPNIFPDPLGVGHVTSLLLSMSAECIASLFVMLGLFTRLASIPVIATMAIVAIYVHVDQPWLKREPSVLFGVAFLCILIMGPGPFSLDAILRRKSFKK